MLSDSNLGTCQLNLENDEDTQGSQSGITTYK